MNIRDPNALIPSQIADVQGSVDSRQAQPLLDQ